MILIKNGRLVDPRNNRDELVDIIIKDDRVFKIGNFNNNEENFEKTIDAKGLIIAPGLIDVHVHFRDPGFTYKEDLLTGANSAAKGGFTTVVCMANTNPIVDNEETFNYVKEKSKEACIKILQAAAITKGFNGKEIVDMQKLTECGVLGFTDDGLPIMDSKLIMDAMLMAKELNVPLSFHEEDPSLIENAGINEGCISKKLGIKGASNVAEDVMVARDCMLALQTGAKVNIQHISSKVSIDLVRFAKSLGANLYAEASPHHFSLTEDDVLKFGTNAKMNPPLRTIEDKNKIIEALKDDTIEIIATDHAPHSKDEKDREFTLAPSGIIGLETSLSLGITNLVKEGHLSLIKLLEKMTSNPAELYNLNAGHIEEGCYADLVIFDLDEKWIVDSFASKATNSPFIGKTLYGKVKYTICNGKIVYKDGVN